MRKRGGFVLVWVILIVLSFVVVEASEGDPCGSSRDCAVNEECRVDVCHVVDDAYLCENDVDCPRDHYCSAGVCERLRSIEAPCDTDSRCETSFCLLPERAECYSNTGRHSDSPDCWGSCNLLVTDWGIDSKYWSTAENSVIRTNESYAGETVYATFDYRHYFDIERVRAKITRGGNYVTGYLTPTIRGARGYLSYLPEFTGTYGFHLYYPHPDSRSGYFELQVRNVEQRQSTLIVQQTPACAINSRNGQAHQGCVGDRCTRHGDCGYDNFCSITGFCAALEDDRCVSSSDCESGSCYRNYCQISVCSNDRQCGEGRRCVEQHCVEDVLFCIDGVSDCEENFVCSAGNRCRRACTADYNCDTLGRNGEVEVCANSRCSELCNNEEANTIVQLDRADNTHASATLEVVNPYTYRHLGQDINLRTMRVYNDTGGELEELQRTLGYRGDVAFQNQEYQLFILSSDLYVLFSDGNYRREPLRETSILGLFLTDPIPLSNGETITVAFHAESRLLVVSYQRRNVATIELRPTVIYYFSSDGYHYNLFINNCNMQYDCTGNAHCGTGQVCQAHTCVAGADADEDAGGLPQWRLDPFGGFQNWNIDPRIFINAVNNCESDADCQEDEACNAGVCELDPGAPGGAGGNEEQGGEGADGNQQGGQQAAGGSGGSGGGGAASRSGGFTPQGSSRCHSNEGCTFTQYCFEGSCLAKSGLQQCRDREGVACTQNEICLNGTAEMIGNTKCCLGNENACVSLSYNAELKAKALIVRGDCVDEDGDQMGVREVRYCYPNAADCSASGNGLIPAADINLDENPYFEECARASDSDLSLRAYWIAGSIGFVIVLGLVLFFVWRFRVGRRVIKGRKKK